MTAIREKAIILALLISSVVGICHLQADEAATSPEQIWIREGFEVDLLYSVPLDEQGSWVCMTVDAKGRFICGDQRGALYRVQVLPNDDKANVERLAVDIGGAQGLLYAYDRLYVTVAGKAAQGPGLYSVRDLDGDDQFDEVTLLKPFNFLRSSTRFRSVKKRVMDLVIRGGHGPHGICLGPDGMLYVIGGNHTAVPEGLASTSPYRNWDEDLLLPRVPDSQGIATGIRAPGGWIVRTDKDGHEWSLFCGGLRNPYTLAFNPQGELLTFEADMEFDTGTPWYRPCRILHLVAGGEYGWRYGSGKWPAYFADSLGAVVDVGRASPTGVTFGTGTRFPIKYRRAMFVQDWAFGKIYTVHLAPQGASYTGTFELFAEGKPLAVVDMRVHPDGNLYFLIGGRKSRSGLYRVRYVGDEPTDKAPVETLSEELNIRRQLEAIPDQAGPAEIDFAFNQLGHPDRYIRFAARTALERQPLARWQTQTLSASQVDTTIQVAIAIARCGTAQLQPAVLQRLNRLPFARMTERQTLDALRAYGVVCARLGEPDATNRQSVIQIVQSLVPSHSSRVNREFCRLLVYLRAPHITQTAMALLESGTTQEDQLFYAFVLRLVEHDWTLDLRRTYFSWLHTAHEQYEGGMSFQGFVARIIREAGSRLPEDQRPVIQELLATRQDGNDEEAALPRQFVHNWQTDDFRNALKRVERGRSFESGKLAFQVAQCVKCHRIGTKGGNAGPDLSGVGSRFSPQYLLDAIINPSFVLPEEFRSWEIVTEDGEVITGRIVDEDNERVVFRTHPYAHDTLTVLQEQIDERRQSKISDMPQGLINVLNEEEVLDLIAYLRAGGNASDAAFAD